MADIGKVKIFQSGSAFGDISISQPNRTTITSSNYRPKPNVAMSEINDVDTTGLQDNYLLIYNAFTNKYEARSSANVSGTPTAIQGGTF
jgi:hypothetical protein